MFARKECESHRFASVVVVGLKGDVYRMRKNVHLCDRSVGTDVHLLLQNI